MLRVFNALYKTNNVYAEGFIISNDKYNEIEGVFALDYAFIYSDEKNTLLNLRTCSWDNGIKYNFLEFFTYPIQITPNNSYIFFNNSNDGLFLEIKNEILNVFEINDVLESLYFVRG